MKQYCRYCNWATDQGGVVWCDENNKEIAISTAKSVNSCKDFSYNEIDIFYKGDVDKIYSPRRVISNDDQLPGQMSILDYL